MADGRRAGLPVPLCRNQQATAVPQALRRGSAPSTVDVFSRQSTRPWEETAYCFVDSSEGCLSLFCVFLLCSVLPTTQPPSFGGSSRHKSVVLHPYRYSVEVATNN